LGTAGAAEGVSAFLQAENSSKNDNMLIKKVFIFNKTDKKAKISACLVFLMRLASPSKIDLPRKGRLREVVANFILNKAKFAIECGQFDKNFNAV
jgi:hypothetical protein